MKRIALVCFIALLPLLARPAAAQRSRTLTVFAASSLRDAFTEIAAAFKEVVPDTEVAFNFGASSTLAAQLQEGASADIFASANDRQMDVARQSGRIGGRPFTFARNRLVLITPADNPARIAGLPDLAKPGLKLVIAAKNVPVRDYTDAMLDRLAQLPDYGAVYKAAFIKNVVSEEDNVRQVAAKVALGEADAGIVYQSDVTPDIVKQVAAFAIPDEFNTIASYPIAYTDNPADPVLARDFLLHVLSETGQSILARWGFVPVLAGIGSER